MHLALSKSLSFHLQHNDSRAFPQPERFPLNYLAWVPFIRKEDPIHLQRNTNQQLMKTLIHPVRLECYNPMLPQSGLALAFINIVQDTARETASLGTRTKVPPPPSNAEILTPQPWGSWGTINESILTMHRIVKSLHKQEQSRARQDIIK